MNKSYTFSPKNSNPLKETRGIRLQKDVELITQQLEHEKREAGYLDEQLRLLQFDMNSLSKAPKPLTSNIKANLSVVEKKLDQERNSLNQTKYKNKQLREKINEYRLDKSAHKQSLNSIIGNLDKTSKVAVEIYEVVEKTIEEDLLQKEKIGMIRSKSASQKNRFDEKISTLGSLLKTKVNGSCLNYEEKNYYLQSVEIVSVLKKMVKQ